MTALTPDGLRAACDFLGCQEHQLKAVIQVEAAGSGFDSQGRPKVLFEPHYMERILNKKGIPDSDPIIQQARADGICSPRWDRRLYARGNEVDRTNGTWSQIERACAIDQDAALASTSWGLGQIMGSNYKVAGFGSVMEMVEAMSTGEDAQLMAMANFIKKSRLDDELREEDWAGFARGYNGPAYHQNRYDTKLRQAAATHLADPGAFWRARGIEDWGPAAGQEYEEEAA